MMRKMSIVGLVICLASMAFGQTAAQQQRGERSDNVVDKVDKLNLLNQILPLIMTKEQIRKILPAIERARQKVRDIEKVESDDLKAIEGKVDAALKDAMGKDAVPSKALLQELAGTFAAMRNRRQLIAEENAQNVAKVVKEVLNAGQIKTEANSINPKLFNPNFKPEEMTQDDRLELFIREILLHPLTYDLLVQMSK